MFIRLARLRGSCLFVFMFFGLFVDGGGILQQCILSERDLSFVFALVLVGIEAWVTQPEVYLTVSLFSLLWEWDQGCLFDTVILLFLLPFPLRSPGLEIGYVLAAAENTLIRCVGGKDKS